MINLNPTCNSIVLPGYEAQLNDDSILHSRKKLETSANELASSASLDRLKVIKTRPCLNVDETLNYRCSCTFQIIHERYGCNEERGVYPTGDEFVGGNNGGNVRYAMRTNQNAVLIGTDHFPIATPRIQNVMQNVMKVLNQTEKVTVDLTRLSFTLLKSNLSSASFTSSWDQSMDCIVSFNYDQPIFNNDEQKEELKQIAGLFCNKCNITILVLRSKKKKVVVGRIDRLFIYDALYLSIPRRRLSESLFNNKEEIRVDDTNEDIITASLNKESIIYRSSTLHPTSSDNFDIIQIQYEKPLDAFQHPNHNAMLHALTWMLTKLNDISIKFRQNCHDHRGHSQKKQTFNLLEMYCGCGAHTIPIAKSRLFDSIVTIELDRRLVESCRKNASLNSCTSSEVIDCFKEEKGTEVRKCTPIHIFEGDAGEWSRKFLRKTQSSSTDQINTYGKENDKPLNKNANSIFQQHYSVLLVDPPRAGLDKQVCELAKKGSFQHIIYISCGREALKKDLVELGPLFEVIDCTLIDLFPRTDSVESLVYLKRKEE